MTVRSFLKKALPIALVLGLFFVANYIKKALPILSGYGAKNLCSCVMVGERKPQDVIDNELASFPLNLGTFTVNLTDSSATGSVYGWAERKAIYRKGLGCTLISQTDESALRKFKPRLAQLPEVDQDTIDWPMGNKVDKFPPFQLDWVKMNELVESAFEYPESRRTRAILVVYKGKLISEKYAEGFNENSKQIGWSMTKSLTNAMVGVLVKKGKLSIDGPAAILEWKQDERSEIKLDDLMRMSSGLNWNEKYSGPSSATNMLFNARHMGIFAAQSKLGDKPGTVFYYSSGTTNIISRLIRQIYSDTDYYRFPYEDIFYKIGMYSLVIEPDAGGTFVGSSYSYATARDWARFGMLYLNNGKWNDEQILPEDWVKYSTTPTRGAKLGQYGAQFWLNAGASDDHSKRTYPDVPADLFWADGFEGQNVFILPSKDLVVVKLSQTTGNALDDNQFLKQLIELLP